MTQDTKQQSNPFSTGGGGVNFETRVQAAFALLLLTQACVPCMSQSMRAKELKFQNKYEGSSTDDFVLVATDKDAGKSKLFAQIKHEITISESIGSEEKSSIFSEVIKSAWKDFNDEKFDREKDSIALITGVLPKLDVHNTLPLLEWARYSSNSSDFIKKVNTKGFTSEAKIKKLAVFRGQLDNANEGTTVTDDELWAFLKVFYLVSFDLDTKNSINANLLCSLIQCYSNESPSLVLAKIITCVQEFNQNAGILTVENTPQDVSRLFQNDKKIDFNNDLLKLRERGDYICEGISSTIGGFHIQRTDYLAQISEAYEEYDFIFVTGPRGTGKSGIVKDFVATKAKDIPAFYLRSEDLDRNHINDVFSSIGLSSTLVQIEAFFSLLPEKFLVLESVEKILELEHQDAFIDLLRFIGKQSGWTVIVTGRDYAFHQLAFNFLQPNSIKFTSVNVGGLTDEQVQQVCQHFPGLTTLISNDDLVEILKIPFFIEIATRAISNGAQFKASDTEVDFKKIVWSSVISKEQDRKSGMHIKRRKAFIDIAIQRAKKMVFGISSNGFDAEVISKLEEDNLIYRDHTTAKISLRHDVLEDWALEEFIEAEYIEGMHDLSNFLSAIGSEPAISRAFRLWLYRRLKFDGSILEFVEKIMGSEEIASFWKDETIAAVLQHDEPGNFIKLMKPHLIKNDCALLIRFCFILRISCQRPSPRYRYLLSNDRKAGILQDLFLLPTGSGWGALLKFIYEIRSELNPSTHKHIAELISDWLSLININDDLPQDSKVMGLVSLWLLEPIKDDYRNESHRNKILEALLKVSPSIETEFDSLMIQDVFIPKSSPRRLGYVDDLASLALVGRNVPLLCKFRPDFIIKLSKHEWLLKVPSEDEFRFHRIDVEESFGLEHESDFFPASGAKGPFKYLLNHHPRKALDFIIELCNLTAQKYAVSEFGDPKDSEFLSDEVTVRELELKLNDGEIIKQYSSPLLWNGYRGHSTLPYLLQCALMALENWLIEYVNGCGEDNQIDWIYDYSLRKSNSVMVTSVLASVAIGFPEKVKKAAFPMLANADLYYLDVKRMRAERGGHELNWFGFKRDVMSGIYIEERRDAALRPWRKESLEMLLTKLQLDPELRESALKIVDELKAVAVTRNEKNLRHMVHRVDTRAWKAVEDKKNNRVMFQNSAELPEDLKQDQREFNDRQVVDNSIIRLNVWARKIYEEKVPMPDYFSSYSEALNSAKEVLELHKNGGNSSFSEMAIGAITTVAAVCIRDELGNLDSEEIEWCIAMIIDAVFMRANVLDATRSLDRTDFDGAGACAFVLPKLFELALDAEEKKYLKFALATALTHENLNVCACAAKGVREFLWSSDNEFASNCLSGVIEYAKSRVDESNSRRFYHLRGEELKAAHRSLEEQTMKFRQNFAEGNFNFSVDEITLESHSSWFLHLPFLMVPFSPTDINQIQLFHKLMNFVFESEYQDFRSGDNEKINHDIKKQMQDCLSDHLVHSRNTNFAPFADLLVSGCSQAPGIIYSITLSFHVSVQKSGDIDAVWSLWQLLAPVLHRIALADVNDRYRGRQNDLNQLLRGMLYADCPWQGHESEQKDIEKGAGHLLDFAKKSAGNSHVFESISSLIYNFHEVFFDEGIQILAEKFSSNPLLIAKQVNTAFYLEMAIGRYLQLENRGPLSRKVYEICLGLLTGIVETGSARAYYLRDHLVRSRKIRD